MLGRLATNPRARFRVRDFEPTQLAILRPFAVFEPEPREGDSIDCPTPSGDECMRVMGAVRRELMAICPCDAHEAPLPAASLNLTIFSLDTSGLAKALRGALGLAGPTGPISDRCWHLGTATMDGARIALVLGLFDDRDAVRELRALPGALPEAVDEVVCLTPTFEPWPEIERALAAIHVRTSRLSGFSMQVSLSELLRPPARTVPLVTLTAAEEQEFLAAGFTCRWPIVVTGRTAAHGANIIEINGEERRFGPATFMLFMRLVAGLSETTGGYVRKGKMGRGGGGGLAAEGYYTEEGMEGAIGRLRQALGSEFKMLVEVGRGMVRLSTHPRYIKASHELLANHSSDVIQTLSARIQRASGSESTRQ